MIDDRDQRAAGDRGARHDRRQVAFAVTCGRSCPGRWRRMLAAGFLADPIHRCAAVPDAAPVAAPRTDPSA
jgi:hypothetical protein